MSNPGELRRAPSAAAGAVVSGSDPFAGQANGGLAGGPGQVLGGLVGPGGADLLGAVHPTDVELTHQTGHLVPADVHVGTAGGLPQLPGPVHPEVVPPQLQQAGSSTASRCARAESGRTLA